MKKLTEDLDKQIYSILTNNDLSLSLILLTFALITFIFCFILAYKTGINDLPKRWYKNSYKRNKEAKKIKNKNQQAIKRLESLKVDISKSLKHLYKSRVRFEKKAYTLLSNELTKPDYNNDIDSLVNTGKELINNANNLIEEVEHDESFQSVYDLENDFDDKDAL